jgi:hypothetical protein
MEDDKASPISSLSNTLSPSFLSQTRLIFPPYNFSLEKNFRLNKNTLSGLKSLEFGRPVNNRNRRLTRGDLWIVFLTSYFPFNDACVVCPNSVGNQQYNHPITIAAMKVQYINFLLKIKYNLRSEKKIMRLLITQSVLMYWYSAGSRI